MQTTTIAAPEPEMERCPDCRERADDYQYCADCELCLCERCWCEHNMERSPDEE